MMLDVFTVLQTDKHRNKELVDEDEFDKELRDKLVYYLSIIQQYKDYIEYNTINFQENLDKLRFYELLLIKSNQLQMEDEKAIELLENQLKLTQRDINNENETDEQTHEMNTNDIINDINNENNNNNNNNEIINENKLKKIFEKNKLHFKNNNLLLLQN